MRLNCVKLSNFADMERFTEILTFVADFLCGYPLFLLLIGGGLFLFFYSGMVPLRLFGAAVATVRSRRSQEGAGQISSVEALASVVAATIGMGNIAGVAIALVLGGPGAIFWMWISAIVGMSTKYHEGVLTIKYKGCDRDGTPQGGTMHIIEQGLGRRWRPLAVFFTVAGMLGTLCILNANQITEAIANALTSRAGNVVSAVETLGAATGFGAKVTLNLLIGVTIATIVALVVLGGIKRIASVASRLVPVMVSVYFFLVAYIIATNVEHLPEAIASIFREAFNLNAGWGALAGIAIIGARRAAFVNDAGIGTATLIHGQSRNTDAAREGLVAMLGPSIDSGLVCTLTAFALLLTTDFSTFNGDVKGLEVAMDAFRNAVPVGDIWLLAVLVCFALSSMFSYSFYGYSCACYLWGAKKARFYTYFFIGSLIIFAVVPLKAAVGMCDLFYAFMAFPTMFTLIMLRHQVKNETQRLLRPKSTTVNL